MFMFGSESIAISYNILKEYIKNILCLNVFVKINFNQILKTIV